MARVTTLVPPWLSDNGNPATTLDASSSPGQAEAAVNARSR